MAEIVQLSPQQMFEECGERMNDPVVADRLFDFLGKGKDDLAERYQTLHKENNYLLFCLSRLQKYSMALDPTGWATISAITGLLSAAAGHPGLLFVIKFKV